MDTPGYTLHKIGKNFTAVANSQSSLWYVVWV